MKRTTPSLLAVMFLLAIPVIAGQEKQSVINIKVSRSVTTITYRAKTSTKILSAKLMGMTRRARQYGSVVGSLAIKPDGYWRVESL